jgi:hypothetical protein
MTVVFGHRQGLVAAGKIERQPPGYLRIHTNPLQGKGQIV